MRTCNPLDDDTASVTSAAGVSVGCWAADGAVVVEITRGGYLVGTCLTAAQAAELVDHLQATIAAVDPAWRARERARNAEFRRLLAAAASDNLP
jgi:hypothetical protein